MTRGRSAQSPRHVPLRGLWDVGMRVFHTITTRNIGLLAAGVAFYALLSLFPAITAGVALAGLAMTPDQLVETSNTLAVILPDAAQEIILGQVNDVVNSDSSGLGLAAIFSIGLAIFSASRATSNFVIGLNVVYDEREKRGFIRLAALTYVLTFVLILGVLLCIGVVAALPAVLSLATGDARLTGMVLILRWPIMFALGVLGLAVLYRFAPSRRRARWHWITPGAALACLLWVIGSLGFSLYVQYFGSYNATFGALGGVIILLTWLWLSAFIVLLGGSLDAELEAQTRVDTTTGPVRPMGDRGAVKADTLGATKGNIREQEGERDAAFAR